MGYCQNQFLPAFKQLVPVVIGFLQLLPVALASGKIPQDKKDEKYHEQKRNDSDTRKNPGQHGNRLFPARLLLLGLINLFLFVFPQDSVQLVGDLSALSYQGIFLPVNLGRNLPGLFLQIFPGRF